MKPRPHTAVLLALTTSLCAATAQSKTPATSPAPAATLPGTVIIPSAVARNRVILIAPDDKRPLAIKSTERNPYARRNPDVDLITGDSDQETEADRIKDILNSLPVTGRSYGPRGLRVLAGEIVFERGKIVDHVVENQNENLIVEAVRESTIELAWIDIETSKLTGKRIVLSYDLEPKVRYVLKGQNKSEDSAEGLKFGLIKSGKPVQKTAKNTPGIPVPGQTPPPPAPGPQPSPTSFPEKATAEAALEGQ